MGCSQRKSCFLYFGSRLQGWAEKIASYSIPVTMMIKESINRAYETSLAEGVHFERRMFHAAFALADQKEGMAAFVGKRKAEFKHR